VGLLSTGGRGVGWGVVCTGWWGKGLQCLDVIEESLTKGLSPNRLPVRGMNLSLSGGRGLPCLDVDEESPTEVIGRRLCEASRRPLCIIVCVPITPT